MIHGYSKAIRLLTILLFVSTAFISCAQKSETTDTETALVTDKIEWSRPETAFLYARDNNKNLYLYFYTDWCSWCRRMESEILSDDKVAEYINANFVPVALDAESEETLTYEGGTFSYTEFASMLGVEGFPTNVFMNASGQPITKIPGYAPADTFIEVLSYFTGNRYMEMEWEEHLSQKESKDTD